MGDQPPRATQKPLSLTLHGITRSDPYAWLRDPEWQEVLKEPEKLDPEIREYLEAENAYTKTVMGDTEQLQADLFAELKGRIKEDDSTVPQPDGDYAYYRRFEMGAEYPLHCRHATASPADTEEILLDVNALAEGHEFCRVSHVSHSPDHATIACSVDTKGSERYQIRFRDTRTGEDLAEVVSDIWGEAVWSADSRYVFYTQIDDNHRPKWVRRHELGTDPADDATLYTEADDGFFVRVEKMESAEYIMVVANDHTSSEIHVLRADDPTGELRCIEPREADVIYSVTHSGDRFFLLVREGDTKDGRIVTAPVDSPGRESWDAYLPHEPGCLVQTQLMFTDHLVRLEMQGALPRIVVRQLSTGEEHTVAFDEAAYSLALNPGYEFVTVLRFSYSSMTTPDQVFDYALDTRERTLRKQLEIPSGHDPDDYRTERTQAPARDGETVPITLLYRKDTPTDAGGPVLLYGYGSYGYSMPASFSPHRLSLVDRGLIYAIAHIRGGKEKGYAWYETAKQTSKKKTFFDFVDAGRHLVESGVTVAGGIAAHGGSAGGMLMGAVANMAPELFAAIVADVPFVDVLNTMCDKDLPLTPPEWPEWGNPLTDREAYDYIASYSPYDNVAALAYPNILALAGLTDPRVTYWEPAKWVARLREMKTDDNLLLLDCNMGAGHAGASGRFDALHKVALQYAFVLKVFGKQ